MFNPVIILTPGSHPVVYISVVCLYFDYQLVICQRLFSTYEMYNLSLLNFQICDVFITGFFYYLNEKKNDCNFFIWICFLTITWNPNSKDVLMSSFVFIATCMSNFNIKSVFFCAMMRWTYCIMVIRMANQQVYAAA